jgi:hypothetical protein
MSTVSEVPEMKPSYPASLSVDYPEKLNRLTTFLAKSRLLCEIAID